MNGFKEFISCGLYDAYCKHLQGVCKSRKFFTEEVGKAGSHPLYCIRINNKRKHTICISAGIHGDEVGGPWSVIKFLQTTNLKGGNHNYVIFPVANPTGFDMCKRRNHLNRDLNRHFRQEELKDENKLIYDAIKKEDLCLLYSIHEHPKAKGFYVYASCDIDRDITARMIALGRKHRFKIRTNHYGKRIPDGEIRLHKLDGDNSFEDRMFEEGVPYIVTETPGTVALHRRINLQCDLLKMTVENYEAEELH